MAKRGFKPGAPRAGRIEHAKRLGVIEQALCSGIPAARIEQKYAEEWNITARHVRNYVGEVTDAWLADNAKRNERDTEIQREKYKRMLEAVYRSAMATKKFGAACNAIQQLTKLDGVGAIAATNRKAVMDRLGPAPLDNPTVGLIWAQKAMLLQIEAAVMDARLDPDKQLRIVSDLAPKVGMTHAKAVVQHELQEIKTRVYGHDIVGNENGVSLRERGISPPPDYRPRGGDQPRDSLRGDVSGSSAGEDGGDPSVSGGGMGSSPKKIH